MREKIISGMVLLMVLASGASAFAEDLPCQAESKKLYEISQKMASVGGSDMRKIEEVSKELDEAEPEYSACITAYAEKNGDEAAAMLEVQLAGLNV